MSGTHKNECFTLRSRSWTENAQHSVPIDGGESTSIHENKLGKRTAHYSSNHLDWLPRSRCQSQWQCRYDELVLRFKLFIAVTCMPECVIEMQFPFFVINFWQVFLLSLASVLRKHSLTHFSNRSTVERRKNFAWNRIDISVRSWRYQGLRFNRRK